MFTFRFYFNYFKNMFVCFVSTCKCSLLSSVDMWRCTCLVNKNKKNKNVYIIPPLLFPLQAVLTSTSKAGGVKTCTCTGSTCTVTFWWFEPRPEGFSTCGTRNTAPTNCRPINIACACNQKPWTRRRTANWGCSSSGRRSKRTSVNRKPPKRHEDGENGWIIDHRNDCKTLK